MEKGSDSTVSTCVKTKMILIIACIVAWLVLANLCGSFWLAVVVHLSTAAALAVFVNFGFHPFRASRVSLWVGRLLMRVSLDKASRDILASLDPKRQYIFACEPHGQAPLHLSFIFAAHGGATMQPALHEKTVVMGHTLIAMFPFMCQLFQLYGVTFSAEQTVQRALQLGAHMALCPSGLAGKLESINRDNYNNHGEKHQVFVVRRSLPRIMKLAAERKALIVPVLSPNEDRAFWNLNPFETTSLFSSFALGNEWFVRPFCAINVRIGAPIDSGNFSPRSASDLQSLTNLYYEKLSELAKPDYTLILR
jgi:hypothetical protein